MHVLRGVIGLLTVALANPSGVAAQATPPGAGPTAVELETSCSAAVAERFNAAVALLHHMTYPAARAEFAAIAEGDPTCAMAHWGVAMTLFQPLWPTRPDAADLERGWKEVLAARSAGPVTGRERRFIDTAAAFFDPSHTDYWERIRRWSDATRVLYENHPMDREARAFFALSLLASAPPAGDPVRNAEVAALLATILREEPGHPGAMHYTIHANDADGRAGESTDVTRGYARVAPRNPHALHMPTHIFVRLGSWQDAITGNERAAAAALETRAGDAGQWTWDEFPHAIEYQVYALLQVGDDSAALAAMNRLAGTGDLEPTFKTAYHVSSIPARYALERRDWAAAARIEPLPAPGLDLAKFPWPQAVTWFARGVGAARSGDLEGAIAAESRLDELRVASEQAREALFASQTEILRLTVAGWIAHLRDDDRRAIQLLEQAVALERSSPKHAVTPAPTIPAGEQLGDLLLASGEPAAALRVYTETLDAYPNRLNSLVGAARAARATGDAAKAADFFRAVTRLVRSDSPRPERAEANAFLRR